MKTLKKIDRERLMYIVDSLREIYSEAYHHQFNIDAVLFKTTMLSRKEFDNIRRGCLFLIGYGDPLDAQRAEYVLKNFINGKRQKKEIKPSYDFEYVRSRKSKGNKNEKKTKRKPKNKNSGTLKNRC